MKQPERLKYTAYGDYYEKMYEMWFRDEGKL